MYIQMKVDSKGNRLKLSQPPGSVTFDRIPWAELTLVGTYFNQTLL